MLRNILMPILLALLLLSCGDKNKKKEENPVGESYDMYLFAGSYTSGTSKGINIYKLNSETGESTHVSETEISNPSYFTIAENGKFVYAVSENDAENSKVTAFKLDKNKGELEEINSQKSGSGPCFISVDETAKFLLTADYGGGTITPFIIKEDGSLMSSQEAIIAFDVTNETFAREGMNSKRQKQSHLHNVVFSPDQRFLFANDLGTDKIYRFRVNKKANNPEDILSSDMPYEFLLNAGTGPRHTEFHPNGKYAYTVAELSGEVLVFDYDANKGLLSQKQVVIADTLSMEGSGDIQITPNGKYLYASNRIKGDGLAIFSIDKETGLLIKIGYQPTGIHPRNFVIAPNGKILLVANRDSNTIQVFKIEENGLLTNLDKNIELSMPVCLKLVSIK